MGILCREFRKVVASGEEREREGGRERNVLWARSRDASACSLENLYSWRGWLLFIVGNDLNSFKTTMGWALMCFPKRGPFHFASLASHTIVKASQVWALSSSALDLIGDVLVPGMFLGARMWSLRSQFPPLPETRMSICQDHDLWFRELGAQVPVVLMQLILI